jgi:hypothetical protein
VNFGALPYRPCENHENPYLFRDTIMKLIASPNLGCKELTAQEADPEA